MQTKNKRQFMLDVFLEDNQQAFYKELLSTGERYETAENYNKVGNGCLIEAGYGFL
jgi:hypothetical protein